MDYGNHENDSYVPYSVNIVETPYFKGIAISVVGIVARIRQIV